MVIIDFSRLDGVSTIRQAVSSPDCCEWLNDRQVCYYIRGASIETINHHFGTEIGYVPGDTYRLIDDDTRNVEGCFLFVKSKVWASYAHRSVSRIEGAVMETDWGRRVELTWQ